MTRLENSSHDLVLWYRKPAQQWVEALPIGNGRLGAMVFGDPKVEHLRVNEETIWTGKPHDYARKEEPISTWIRFAV